MLPTLRDLFADSYELMSRDLRSLLMSFECLVDLWRGAVATVMPLGYWERSLHQRGFQHNSNFSHTEC